MKSTKREVIKAWLREQVSLGAISEHEAKEVSSCSTIVERIQIVCRLVEKTGDSTPLEIVAGHEFFNGKEANTHS